MVTFTKKRKILIVVLMAAAILVLLVPTVVYALPASDSNLVGSSRTLTAKGIDRQVVDGKNVTVPANLTLTLERTGTNTSVPKFNVVRGSVVVNGATYAISSGNGGVLRGKHLILLQAQGLGPDGQPITLRLAGRYFWMGGHLFVVKIGAHLFTDNGNSTLLLRAAIRV
ncbi:MAG: hypothetical protein ACM3UL_00820 [Ignavibacteria bacterium]